jgi:LPS sulfotransferase NodH
MGTRFAIFAHPRTGSYNLVSLLNSAADIACYGELFKPHWVELDATIMRSLEVDTVEKRDADPMAFLDSLCAATPEEIFGFKIFNYHLRRVPAVVQELSTQRWKLVVLCRDPIETYASTLRAQSTNVWTLKEGQSKPEENILKAKISFSPDSIEKFAVFYNRFLDKAKEWHDSKKAGEMFTIFYNQVGCEKPMKDLLRFLGSSADPRSLKSEYIRQFAAPLEDGFANWDELCSYTREHWPFHTLPTASTALPERSATLSAANPLTEF